MNSDINMNTKDDKSSVLCHSSTQWSKGGESKERDMAMLKLEHIKWGIWHELKISSSKDMIKI